MAKQSLTDLSVRKLSPSENGRYDIWDTRVRGLGIRVFKSGVKSFFLSYRMNGQKRRDTLGRYPEISLADVRQLAYEQRAQIARGDDPVAIAKSNAQNFEIVLNDFIELYIKRYNKPSTQRSTSALLKNECFPIWRNRPVGEIERKDIIAILDAMVARGSGGAANNAYAAMSKFFNWCASRDIIDISPCIGVVRPTKRNTRDRVLSDIELAKVWSALRNTEYPFGNIASLLILTGQRRGEVTNMEWDQIDWDDKVWRLPDTLKKSRKPHSLPLSEPALEIIQATPQLNGQCFLFPARGSTSTCFSGFGKSKMRLDREVQIDPWCLHDLRRTTATGMAKLEVPPHIVERVLNHSSGQLGGIAGVYNRFQYLGEMRKALDLWAAHVMALQNGK